jgi:glycosyltransferase involved in cell wall biosynthesis
MTPRVTVLIPNYNGARFLDHCFEGLINQTTKNFRCIFLDDGSTDNSVELACRYQLKLPQIEIREFENGGIAANWNRGLELVETEFFTLLHCDDSYEPEYLEEMIRLLDNFPKSGLGHCASQVIDDSSGSVFSITEFYKHARFLPEVAFQREISEEYRLLLMADFINCPSVMYRSQAVQEIGCFDTKLEQTLDWDYWFRCLRAGYKICGTGEKLYRYRRHNDNHTVTNSKNMKRYHEELNCLRTAISQGIASGISCSEVLDTSGLRNIVIVDIANALRAGSADLVISLIGFLQDNLGVTRTTLALLNLFVSLRQVGGYLLYGVIRAVVFCIALRTKLLGGIGSKTQARP